MREASATDGVVVSVATLVDLWYVTQTTNAITTTDLERVRAALETSPQVALLALDVQIADIYTTIPSCQGWPRSPR